MDTTPQPTPPATVWIGLDVSKDVLEACLLTETGKPQYKAFPNEAAGHQKLLRWVQHLAPEPTRHFALEATGAYSQAIALFLADAQQRVSVLNPARVKYGGIAMGQGNKTDKADARVIAHYCRLHAPPVWREAAPEVRHLRALVRRQADIRALLAQEKNRASVPGLLPAVRHSLERSLAYLEGEVNELQRQIEEHIRNVPSLKTDRDLLTSVPGVGDGTAQILLAELPDVKQFDSAEKVAAWAGLCPQECRSGSSVRKRTRLSKAGNGHVRKALYFPAISAIRHNPLVRALYQRLRDAGKSSMAAIGAAMRKLLMLCYGVLIAVPDRIERLSWMPLSPISVIPRRLPYGSGLAEDVEEKPDGSTPPGRAIRTATSLRRTGRSRLQPRLDNILSGRRSPRPSKMASEEESGGAASGAKAFVL